MDQLVADRPSIAPVGPSAADPEEIIVVARRLDASYYRHRYADVRAARVDPAAHYCNTGWREGRDPADWFDTKHYLLSYPDIAAAGINPFWHYLVQGRQEGRLPHPDGLYWRREMLALLPPSRPPAPGPADRPTVTAVALRRRLDGACLGARGLVVSLSHDRYLAVPGGTQVLIADEQRKFNGDNGVYLHLSPSDPRLGLAPPDAPARPLTVILDGQELGMADMADITAALAGLPAPGCRILAVHNLHGHRPEDVLQLAEALQPRHAFFWAHDYGAGCGNPLLLRNDIAACGAPPADSMACRVCVHGERRKGHLARMRALFDAIPFRLLAPSAAALGEWLRAAPLPLASAHVHPHAELVADPHAAARRPAEPGPVRVAFVGQASFHKGWGLFRDLALATRDLGAYQFFQFAGAGDLQPHDGVAGIVAATSPDRPFGMVRALADHGIDLVLAASPWPETFGYVPHEAIAAGADVATIEASGNIAAMLRASGRGLILPDEPALIACFQRLDAARHALARRDDPAPPPRLRHIGSTATFALDTEAAPERLTSDPDLQVWIGEERVSGTREGDSYRFTLPAAGQTLRLRSRTVEPQWEAAFGADHRRLGIAVGHLALDGEPVPADDVRRSSGWHAPEAGWQWTDGDATLHVGAARTLDITILPFARYWQSPLLAP